MAEMMNRSYQPLQQAEIAAEEQARRVLMKKALGLAVLMLFVGSTTAFGQMVGNSHDFSSTNPLSADYYGVDLTSTDYDDQICVVCHAPHNVEATYEATYLWNRANTDASTYSMYSSSTLDGSAVNGTEPATESKMCLSCHDGTVGLEDFNGGTTGTVVVQDSMLSGSFAGNNLDLSREHPISLTYDVTDDGLIAVATAEGGGVNLYSDGTARIECGSCHDPHLANITAEATENAFLRVPNTQSDLCTTCHDK